jgi:hypothetical protein
MISLLQTASMKLDVTTAIVAEIHLATIAISWRASSCERCPCFNCHEHDRSISPVCGVHACTCAHLHFRFVAQLHLNHHRVAAPIRPLVLYLG